MNTTALLFMAHSLQPTAISMSQLIDQSREHIAGVMPAYV